LYIIAKLVFVDKCPSLDNQNQLLMSVEPTPSLLRGLGQLVHHRQARFPRAIAFRPLVP
jgi:hypothetical protein